MFHEIVQVKPLSNYRLWVQFTEGTTKLYDLKPLIARYSAFDALKDLNFYFAVKVDAGRHGVIWNDVLDLSGEEIWNNGIIAPGSKPSGRNIVKHYDPNLVEKARALRKNMTKQEKHLWYDFLKDHSFRFYRQREIGHYILDFYCAKARLCIELDGRQHGEEMQAIYDQERTDFLNQKGIEVIRFSNFDIDHHFEEVCKAINLKVWERVG